MSRWEYLLSGLGWLMFGYILANCIIKIVNLYF